MSSQNELLFMVLETAREAGRRIMQIYDDGAVEQKEKSDGSPLTAADMASHRAIVAGLEEATPDWPVLSEESAEVGYHLRRTWERFWLVDPLDGTKEFIKRNGEFTVNIALVEHGVPVMGVVYAPVLEVAYYAERGAGAFVQRGNSAAQPIRVAQHLAGPVRVVASRSHSDERTAALLAKLGEHQCVGMGSSLKLCLVAEGRAQLYPRLGPTMEWDTAAAHAVVNEAGGTVCDLGGNELQYNKPDLHNPEFFVCHRDDKGLFGRIIANAN